MNASDRLRLATETAARQTVLATLAVVERQLLLEQLIQGLICDSYRCLTLWGAVTGQSSQIDLGYISQHVASVVFGVPGQGFKGKGKDVADGSEVKAALAISGVDRPRWNHTIGGSDKHPRPATGLWREIEMMLGAPRMLYVLLDRSASEPDLLRLRAWCISSKRDAGWRGVLLRYAEKRRTGERSNNLQLHPPIGYDDDIVVNEFGNLDFAPVKVFEVRFALPADRDAPVSFAWITPLTDGFAGGRTVALPHVKGGRGTKALPVFPQPSPGDALALLRG